MKNREIIMLLDKYLPEFDFTEDYIVPTKAGPEAAYRAIKEVTLAEISGIVRVLIFLRTLPERVVGRKCDAYDAHAPILAQLCNGFFTYLAEQPPQEIVIGLIVPEDVGRIWKKSSDLDIHPSNAAEYFAFKNPSYLKVVCNFLVEDAKEPGCVTVRAEFRTGALSPRARKSFAPYWRIIGPFSHLIQKLWLKGIKRRAEKIALPAAA
jgi:hypothetical protein